MQSELFFSIVEKVFAFDTWFV
jgi:hypothetical protein